MPGPTAAMIGEPGFPAPVEGAVLIEGECALEESFNRVQRKIEELFFGSYFDSTMDIERVPVEGTS